MGDSAIPTPDDRSWASARSLGSAAALTAVALACSGVAAAHVGTVQRATAGGTLPQWFVVAVAGIVVAASFLFTSLMADHEGLRWVNGLALSIPIPTPLARAIGGVLGLAGFATLLGILVVGVFGPSDANYNAAALVVWVGWWGGFTMTTYVVGNAWPALDPFRRLADLLPGRPRRVYPEGLGSWPAVAGLLALVFVEVVVAASERPRTLTGLIVLYGVVTVVGAWLVGTGAWLRCVDPIAAVFRTYGSLAPIQRTDDGLALRLPGAALIEGDVYDRPGDVGFVIALLWATTYDGLVSTPPWRAALSPIVDLGVPAIAVYVLVLAGGFGVFYAVYWYAARMARRAADSYVTAKAIGRWLAPSLVPIAAGYHLAHFLGLVLTLAPQLLATLGAPLSGPAGAPLVAVLPEWFGFLQLAFVLGGHMLAIWVAHSIAFELFPGALQPIHSQYPLIAVMIAYTLVSAWIIVSPSIPTPFV